MVGGDHINGAVQDTFHQRIPIFSGAKGRIHLESAVFLQIVVTKPPTEPPVEPPTEPAPSNTEAPDSETITSPDGTEELPTKRGCASAVSSFSLLALLSPLPLWLKKRKILTYKGENHET
jgi:hypothetical protein